MTRPNNEVSEKKPYSSPQLTIHGDIETITLGSVIGEAADAAFTNTIVGEHDNSKKKINRGNQFS